VCVHVCVCVYVCVCMCVCVLVHDRKGSDQSALEMNLMMADIKANRALAEKCLESLTATISNSERIVKTSVPQAYSKHTSRSSLPKP